MEKKYINEARYKKVTSRKRRDINKVRASSNSKNNIKIKSGQQQKSKSKKQVHKKKVTRRSENKVKNIVICIVLIIIIAIISRAILKDENEPFISFPFITNSNDEVIKLGVITTSSLLDVDTNNIVLNELNKYSKDVLLEINNDYSITYKIISNVKKVSNKEYIIIKNEESKVTANDIKEALDQYRKNENSVYYKKLSNIASIMIKDNNTLVIKLNKNDPYFVFNLDISLDTNKEITNYIKDGASTDSMLVLNRHKHADKELPQKIVVTRYKDVYAAVESYKAQDINMFVTNAANVQNILGKYEYNITSYRNGQSIFLFGNPKSKMYSKQEIRQAIAYSIDRDSIIQNILNSKGTKIDLPYVYDVVKYKYDIYAAENLLLTNGYKKSNNLYSKTENSEKIDLELDLIVNKEDEIKVSIANKIKKNLGAIGIKINVEKIAKSKILTKIKAGDYDILLASVNLNNNPDITFVKDKLFITNDINQAITGIQNSTVQDLNKNISLLQSELSKEVSAIGIYSEVSYLIYSKDIIGIENANYMNLFASIFN